MENSVFQLGFDSEQGLLTSLVMKADKEQANFIKPGKGLGEPGKVPYYAMIGVQHKKAEEEYKFVSFREEEKSAACIFERRGVVWEQTVSAEAENIVVCINIINRSPAPVYFKKEDLSFYMPFADSYDGSDVCEAVRCHTHINAALENSYIQVERMGKSEQNIGVVFTKGSICSYSQENAGTGKSAGSGERGYFLLNVSPFHLLKDQSYQLEFVLFPYRGGEDFFTQIKQFDSYVDVRAIGGFTVYHGESSELQLTAAQTIRTVSLQCNGKRVPCAVNGNTAAATIEGQGYGEKEILYEINGIHGVARFFVSERPEILLKRRVRFIIDKQQCLEKDSPLYGAYLIYDNEEQRQYFSYYWTDHNANRERMGMGIFLAKYARLTQDRKAEKSLNLFTDFLLRECVEEESGKAYNNIGKDAGVKRLYNAPWVILYFCELYLLQKNERWLKLAAKMLKLYYENGGRDFYPNGIRPTDMLKAFEVGGSAEYPEIVRLFEEHTESILRKDINYPPHEVNYEQTIVTPACCFLLEEYLLTGAKRYLTEARKHLELLIKFNGSQPDYRLNKQPIRYWDNYWFGKTNSCSFGDTFPHPATAHSAYCFFLYGKLTNDRKWIDYGAEEFKNCLCLFGRDGRAYSSYVYPERVNGYPGAHYDPFANEQDGFLYFFLKLLEMTP